MISFSSWSFSSMPKHRRLQSDQGRIVFSISLATMDASTITGERAQRARDEFLRPLGGEWEAIVASGMGIEPVFPKFIKAVAGMNAAQGQNVFGTSFTPEHARLLAAGANDCFASGFDNT